MRQTAAYGPVFLQLTCRYCAMHHDLQAHRLLLDALGRHELEDTLLTPVPSMCRMCS